jgi:shikimate dehydrogenase
VTVVAAAPPGPVRRLFGLLGDPVSHSLSPAIHAEAFRLLAVPGAYVAFQVSRDELPAALAALRVLRVAGVNVTIPHKEAVTPLLDALSHDAAAIQAVNCVALREGRLVGHNTDAPGVRLALSAAGALLGGHPVAVLGAGGAARAAAFALAGSGASEVRVFARDGGQASRLCGALRAAGARAEALPLDDAGLLEGLPGAMIVVNATPVGLEDAAASPLSDDAARALMPGAAVLDLVYRPLETRFLRQARARGCTGVDGLKVLVRQAMASLAIWLDRTVDAALAPALRAAALRESGGI